MRFFILFFLFSKVSYADQEISIPFLKKDWQVLKYSGIQPNEVKFEKKSLTIGINNSASPLIYPLRKPVQIKGFSIVAKIKGNLNLKKSKQGEKGNDDFLLRVGFVFEGKKVLSFIKRQFAPSWIKKLFSLAPKGTGVDHILFFNVYSDPRLAKQKRNHPHSDLLVEKFVIQETQNREIKAIIPVSSERNVLALWISSDGDDTKSKYSVTIDKLTLKSQ